MIIPNLMVADVGRSVAFYRDVIGMTLSMAVFADRSVRTDGDGAGAVFATLDWKGGQLMLQTAASLAEDLDIFRPDQAPVASGTIYVRDGDPDAVAARAPAAHALKGPVAQWYGMVEFYLRDPDGYVVCVGRPANPPA